MNYIPGIRWCPTSSSAAKSRLRGGLLLLIVAEQFHVGRNTFFEWRARAPIYPRRLFVTRQSSTLFSPRSQKVLGTV